MTLKTFGTMGVDWEQRVDFERLRTQRLERIKQQLADSELGALLCFDMNNIRYITATHIGMWALDKLVRFCLLPQGDEPIMWDFGSAARHHALYSPWLDGTKRSRAGISTLRGAIAPEAGRAEAVARKIRVELEERGLMGEPLGVDVVEHHDDAPEHDAEPSKRAREDQDVVVLHLAGEKLVADDERRGRDGPEGRAHRGGLDLNVGREPFVVRSW